MTSTVKYNLTSTALVASPDGEYSFAEVTLLVPHEALRRQFSRGEAALKSFDLITHPWKIHCFHFWYHKFLLPSIEEHHNLEETIFFPYFLKLGNATPEKQCEDHKGILIRVNKISQLTTQLDALVRETEKLSENTETIREMTASLKTEFHELIVHTNEHLAEEELFWPKVMLQCGEKKSKEAEQMVVNHGINHGGQDFQNFGCAVLEALGITISPTPDPHIAQLAAAGIKDDLTGWACERIRKDMLATFPYFPVRTMMLPGWNKRYQHFTAVILSCQGDVDVLHVQDKVAAAGCQCTIM